MPRYTVEWTWSCEWTVDAQSEEVAAACARNRSVICEALDQSSGPRISIYCERPSCLEPLPDAVAIDGTLYSPDDARAEWERLVALEEGKR